MKELKIDYTTLKKRLNEVKCPYRLYWARIRALEIATGQNLEVKIREDIIDKIEDYLEAGYRRQFERDMDVYGLYEAILYFHSYPFTLSARDFVDRTCKLYHYFASLYMAHHEEIVESDDLKIQAQLSLLRTRGDNPHNMPGLRMSAMQAPQKIQSPVQPKTDPKYTRKLPINKSVKHFYTLIEDSVSKIHNPGNLADELIEHLDAQFMFEGFPGLSLVFFEVAYRLKKFNIDPFSSTGQYVISTICEHMKEEYYGDFDRWTECILCSKEFKPRISLPVANSTLTNGGLICKECQSSQI